MFFVLFVLSDPSKCDDLLTEWEDAGVKGATILASSGLGRIRLNQGLRDDFPLFPSLHDILEHDEKLSRTLFTVVDSDEMVDKILEKTQNVIGDLNGPDTGIFIVLPVARVYGLRKNREY
ncbi:MAG: hypothetical protein CVU39_18400 [Chloroflexi bacterium HGW-Chloroflexi-10]|nr:MAG: hypothetical protein CVU39_18400 [Chloroflexi bacterium HGW-Chloroflexi-10]